MLHYDDTVLSKEDEHAALGIGILVLLGLFAAMLLSFAAGWFAHGIIG